MWNNVPDDWYQFEFTCKRCGSTYHASEGYCSCCCELFDEEAAELKLSRDTSLDDYEWKEPDYNV
jgi:hypothetical protein